MKLKLGETSFLRTINAFVNRFSSVDFVSWTSMFNRPRNGP